MLSQVMKLATETDSKLEFIIDAKLVETAQQMKEIVHKIEVSRSSVQEDTVVKDVVHEILENERRKVNIIIHNVPELDSKDRENRVDHDKKEIISIAGFINVDIDIVKVIRLGKKVEGKDRLMLAKLKEGTMVRECLSNAKKLKTVDDWKVFITPELDKQERLRNKELHAELWRHRKDGEENLIIHKGKIVDKKKPTLKHFLTEDTKVKLGLQD